MTSWLKYWIPLLAAVSAGWAQGEFPDDWFFYGAERPAELRALEGEEAPRFAAAEWRGDSVDLDGLRGKVVVLDFWATWCGPCIAAIPKNVELVEKYGDDLAFIGIHDSNSGWDRVDAVIAEKGINYPTLLDDGGASTKAYKVKFWPTYVLIDREGVVRAAGMSPAHVGEAVKMLLAEPYAGAPAEIDSSDAGFPDEFFFGAERRPSWLRSAEGEALETLVGEDWIGDPIAPDQWRRKVLVVQFVHSTFGSSFDQLDSLAWLQSKYGRQGVVFVAVSDARADWDAVTSEIAARDVKTPVLRDEASDTGPAGRVAEAFGVRFSQPLAVVDRAGVIRAVGLNPEHLEAVLNTLLAEPMPPAETSARSGS